MAAFPNVNVRNVAGLNIPQHDYVSITYVGGTPSSDDADISQVVFKEGGSSGTTVATVNFTYHGSTNNIATVTKS